MTDIMDTIDFAYVKWRNRRDRGVSQPECRVSVNGITEICLNNDTLPFFKIAVIRKFVSVYGVPIPPPEEYDKMVDEPTRRRTHAVVEDQ